MAQTLIRSDTDGPSVLLVSSELRQGPPALDAAAVRGVLDDCLEHVCIVDDPPELPPPPSVPRPSRAVSLLLQSLLGKSPASQARWCLFGFPESHSMMLA